MARYEITLCFSAYCKVFSSIQYNHKSVDKKSFCIFNIVTFSASPKLWDQRTMLCVFIAAFSINHSHISLVCRPVTVKSRTQTPDKYSINPDKHPSCCYPTIPG